MSALIARLLRRLALAAEAEDDVAGRHHRADAVIVGRAEACLQFIAGRRLRPADTTEEGDVEGHGLARDLEVAEGSLALARHGIIEGRQGGDRHAGQSRYGSRPPSAD